MKTWWRSAGGLTGSAAAVIEGLAYQTDADWAALAALDEVLAQSIVSDRWYPDAARLRAAWRLNATEDRERFAAEALAFIEQIMLLVVDEDLHRMRATSARILGDGERLVESSQYLIRFTNDYLTELANEGRRLPAEELAQVRQNVAVIANNLGDDFDVADAERLSTARERVDGLIRYLDDYPQAP